MYALYMQAKLDLHAAGNIAVESFEVDVTETAKQIEHAITKMGRSKAEGGEQPHLYMPS